ncbi:MAG TPA: TIGR03000 domain-containing protein [Gemmataceae bacterium]|nr:TIGR03000 domain-containing protein [Gemmataceae bacterium]
MYTAVLMLAMVSSSETADFGRRGGGGCCGGGGYYGGYGGGCSGRYYGGCGGYYGGGYAPMSYGSPYGSGGYYAPGMMAQNSGSNPNQINQSFYNDPSGATIHVLMPNPSAKLWFDDKATTQTGPDRIFFTPSLQSAGKYTVKARWTEDGREVNRQRTVNVQPGQTVMLDLRQESGESVPNPKTTGK